MNLQSNQPSYLSANNIFFVNFILFSLFNLEINSKFVLLVLLLKTYNDTLGD